MESSNPGVAAAVAALLALPCGGGDSGGPDEEARHMAIVAAAEQTATALERFMDAAATEAQWRALTRLVRLAVVRGLPATPTSDKHRWTTAIDGVAAAVVAAPPPWGGSPQWRAQADELWVAVVSGAYHVLAAATAGSDGSHGQDGVTDSVRAALQHRVAREGSVIEDAAAAPTSADDVSAVAKLCQSCAALTEAALAPCAAGADADPLACVVSVEERATAVAMDLLALNAFTSASFVLTNFVWKTLVRMLCSGQVTVDLPGVVSAALASILTHMETRLDAVVGSSDAIAVSTKLLRFFAIQLSAVFKLDHLLSAVTATGGTPATGGPGRSTTTALSAEVDVGRVAELGCRLWALVAGGATPDSPAAAAPSLETLLAYVCPSVTMCLIRYVCQWRTSLRQSRCVVPRAVSLSGVGRRVHELSFPLCGQGVDAGAGHRRC